jgi:hypothetical protein
MAAFNFQLQGFPAANRDAVVTMTQESTGQSIQRSPFLDGSLIVRDLDPGFYQVTVTHPNLFNPIYKERVRLFPQPEPTFVPITVPAYVFVNAPVSDTPAVSLAPVQQKAQDIGNTLKPILTKSPGEAIRAADWNILAGAVSDLAGTMLQFTNLVSPLGHTHADILNLIGQVQENIRQFSEAVGRSLLQLQREIEVAALRQTVTDVLGVTGPSSAAQDNVKKTVTDSLNDLASSIQVDTPVFTQKLAATGTLLASSISDLAQSAGPNASQFLQQAPVQQLSGVARTYTDAGTQTTAFAELQTYQRSTAIAGGTFTRALKE